MELLQIQTQKLTQQQLQSIELLQMSTLELEAFLQDLAQENPLVELNDHPSPPAQESQRAEFAQLRWLEETDRQNRYYQRGEDDFFDPLFRAATDGGLEETLQSAISRQLEKLALSREQTAAASFLAACLDDDGYLRISLDELARQSKFSLPLLQQARQILCSLEPAGIGAHSVPECLELQLLRIGEERTALDIVRSHLESLARHHYRAIAASLSVSMEQVRMAERLIQQLDPRPGLVFAHRTDAQYIQPDVFVTEEDGRFLVRIKDSDRVPFQISPYYLRLLSQSPEREVKEYLTGKLRQAESIKWAIEQRESTLLRCAQVIVDEQQNFFRFGPQTLLPLRMSDVAEQLGVHESTVSRTVREKYLQCARGVYPLSFFFSRSAAADNRQNHFGATAAKTLLRQLVDGEDKRHPLSDQKLCALLAEQGCVISRRTAAKYREELNIPGTAGRRLP